MSLKNLGNKQTIVIHNCQIENHKYDLVITPHTQTIEYIHTKRQTLKRTIQKKKEHEKDFQNTETHFPTQKSVVSTHYTK